MLHVFLDSSGYTALGLRKFGEGRRRRTGTVTGMATSQPLPSSQDLEALAHAAIVNSRQQLATAELLLENGHWPVAHALSTLALEEVGKAFLCIFTSTSPEIFRDFFWKVFVSHTIKLQLAHAALAPMAAGTAAQPSSDPVQAIMAFGQMAKNNHSTKMRGLYVDYTDGAILDPADVTEQDAQTMVAHARAALDHLASATTDKGLDPELRAILVAGADHFTSLFNSPDTDLYWHSRGFDCRQFSGVAAPPKPRTVRDEGACSSAAWSPGVRKSCSSQLSVNGLNGLRSGGRAEPVGECLGQAGVAWVGPGHVAVWADQQRVDRRLCAAGVINGDVVSPAVGFVEVVAGQIDEHGVGVAQEFGYPGGPVIGQA